MKAGSRDPVDKLTTKSAAHAVANHAQHTNAGAEPAMSADMAHEMGHGQGSSRHGSRHAQPFLDLPDIHCADICLRANGRVFFGHRRHRSDWRSICGSSYLQALRSSIQVGRFSSPPGARSPRVNWEWRR